MSGLAAKVRAVLRANPDGLTIKEINERLGASDRWSLRDTLQRMPDAYIDRWTKEPATRGRYAAVWCVVVPPPNCPPPEKP